MAAQDARIAVVTGASAGIGAATAHALAKEGFHVVLGARRMDKLTRIADDCGGTAMELDVADPFSVERFCAGVERCDVLVNNAGFAANLRPVAELTDDEVEAMWQVNVMGTLRMTRALLPLLEASGRGHIVNLGSVAGREIYGGGGGYTAAKYAVRTITRTLRLELLGKPIRITEIAPGMVETEFSIVRFEGDVERAKKLYEGMTPLTGEDIADCIAWAVTRPSHVNIDEMVVRPLDQAAVGVVHRSSR